MCDNKVTLADLCKELIKAKQNFEFESSGTYADEIVIYQDGKWIRITEDVDTYRARLGVYNYPEYVGINLYSAPSVVEWVQQQLRGT